MSWSTVSFVGVFVGGIIAAVYWRRHQQRILKGFGFGLGWWALGDLVAGLGITGLAMVGIFVVELVLGAIAITGTRLDWGALGTAIGMVVIGAFLEELLYRSLLLSGVVIVLGGRTWPAVLLTAVVFGVVHLGNPGASAVSALGNTLGGVIYGIAFVGGRNFWLPLGLHIAWNGVQGPILGFPVSGFSFGGVVVQQPTGPDWLTGGAYGPEAGLVGIAARFVVIALVLGYLHWRCHGQGDLRTPDFPIADYDNPPRTPRAGAARPRAG